MDEETLWSSIEAETTPAIEGVPVHFANMSFQSPIDGQNYLARRCTYIAYPMLEFLENCPTGGNALDLGCAMGSNSIPLLKKGWKVTGIDRYAEMLEIFRKAQNGALTLIHDDVNNFAFPPNEFDLVIGANFLNFIAPKNLRQLMMKIHQTLIPNGLFIGTLGFDEPGKINPAVEPIRNLGAYFYRKETAPALLAHSGFQIEQCIPRYDEGVDVWCLQFVARKNT